MKLTITEDKDHKFLSWITSDKPSVIDWSDADKVKYVIWMNKKRTNDKTKQGDTNV